jgi:hypothetical protein
MSTKTNTTTKTTIPAKTPCERAQESTTKAEAADTRTQAIFVRANRDDIPEGEARLGDEAIREIGDLATESASLLAAAQTAAQIACQGDIPHARRLAASSRAKRAAEGAEEIAQTAQAIADEGEAEEDDAIIEAAENKPGYTTDPAWLAAQERRAARLHRA